METDPWAGTMKQGIEDGFRNASLEVELTVEYLQAHYWNAKQEEQVMYDICLRAIETETDLILTAYDEALYSLWACRDSLELSIPVVFFGVEFLNYEVLRQFPDVTGFVTPSSYNGMLQTARSLFPERKRIITVTSNSRFIKQAYQRYMEDWEIFLAENPGYEQYVYNLDEDPIIDILYEINVSDHAEEAILVSPYWGLFTPLIASVSKVPCLAVNGRALGQGAVGSFGTNPFEFSRLAALRGAEILKGTSPSSFQIVPSEVFQVFDYELLHQFGISKENLPSGSIVINEPYHDKYPVIFALVLGVFSSILIFIVCKLILTNRREYRHRIQAQTRLQLQEELVAQRNEFDHIFHSMRDGLITFDTEFRIHYTNLALHRMLKLPDETVVRPYEGMTADAVFQIYNNGEEILYPMLRQVLETDSSLAIPEGSFIRDLQAGHNFLIAGVMVPVHGNDGMTGVALSLRNISEEEMQKRFFRMAIEESPVYPWQYNVENDCFAFQEGFLSSCMGLPAEVSVLSRTELGAMIHPEDRKRAQLTFERMLEEDNAQLRVSARYRNGTGQYEWWEFRSSVFSGMDEATPYDVLGVCQSIQRYKETEEQLISARDRAMEADKLKSAFLANMSHEIRTPLNAIVGFSDLLRNFEAFSKDEIEQFVETITTNCELLLALISDILDLSRIESNSMEFHFVSHDLTQILTEVYHSQLLNMPPNVKLLLQVPAEEKRIVTDAVRLKQVINNLINNAAKFTRQGHITFGYIDPCEEYTCFFVEDTGPGMEQEKLDHIFDRFYKIDNFTQGAGLGLSICKTIVDRLHGTLEVTSEVGVGTRFTVCIPNQNG
ncbi:MAG: PAS domain-containing protein [Bacteroides sp.]|nr:PAS domain-containing protein [Bacteroides sp.]